MLPEIVEIIQKAAGVAILLAVINVVTAFIVRNYLFFVVVRRQQVDMEVRPPQKQWVEFVAPFQDVEFKGLLALVFVILIVSFLIRQVPIGVGLIVIMVGLSFFTFTIGLARPTYYLTPEGLIVLNWYPPYMNRNMGFFRWSVFEQYIKNEDGVMVGSKKKLVPIVCGAEDVEAVRRYVRRMMNRQRAAAGLEVLD
jgi:hypothetical protein